MRGIPAHVNRVCAGFIRQIFIRGACATRNSLRGLTMAARHVLRKAVPATVIVGALLVAPAAIAANTAIYKCVDQHFGIAYTDQPCTGGQQLDIHPGDADPVATARLERVRDELDRSAAARLVDLRREAAQKELAGLMRQQRDQDRVAAVADSSPTYYAADVPWYPAFLPPRQRHPARPRHHHSPPTQAPNNEAPNPPYLAPRS